jgi:hypothetical protein
MNIKLLRSVALAAAITIGGSVALFAGEAPKEDAAMAAKLITAIAKSDHQGFIADGDAPFRQFKKQQFEAVSGKPLPDPIPPQNPVSYQLCTLDKGVAALHFQLAIRDSSRAHGAAERAPGLSAARRERLTQP